MGCASKPVVVQKKKKYAEVSSNYCKTQSVLFEKKNLVTVAQIKSSVMVNCFKNYLRFEKEKNQVIGSCNQLSIKRNGRVSHVQVTDLRRKKLPKDFSMCLKQEFWKMSFKGLDLTRPHFIEFPLNFQTK
jgi:hypothetical protein